MPDLLALADRVEKLTGPDRKVDAEIARIMQLGDGAYAPAYSASLDAAITLVPEGWDWSAASFAEDGASAEVWEHGWQEDTKINSFLAVTAALALTVACLRARASTDKGEA